ncbi:hypothetical protein CGC20_3885 [Leishmania donovani]|uniref:Uncharacterized protein n=1 Tax=Leishmania donovani TaxID=5661 RepID=A0A504X968_LEIDO|nr:hypothetical protein CGC20_3885 [Leishmania donovani]
MQTAPPTQQRRTFSRANGADGTAVPRLVAAEERHRKNLHQIQQLKQALCSTVMPPPSNPSWMAPFLESPSGVVASLSQTNGATVPVSRQSTWTPVSAAALRESHQEVERLVQERNKLQQQCVEWASLLGEASHRAAESAGTNAPLVSHSGVEADAWSPVHQAALAVVRQATRCYPSALREARIKSDVGATEDTSTPQCAGSSALIAPHEGELSEPFLHGNSSPPLTTEELANALHRLAEFLPSLASTMTASELVAASEPDLLHRIRTLEEERRSDCLVVLSITDHLTQVATQLRREAAEKDEALHALQETVEALMEEKSQWARRARESEEALAERYEQYSQREKAWERELQQELDAKEATLATLEEEHQRQLNPLEEELQTQACIIGSTLRKVEDLSVAHQAETAALTESHNAFLAGKEVTLLSLQEAKERIEVELAERTADAAQMRAELEAALGKLAAAQSASDRPGSSSLVHDGVSVGNSSVVESTDLLRPTGPSEGDGADASLQMDGARTPGKCERAKNDDAEDAAESPTKLVDVRKLQQSLNRMSRERTALKRKLEHRAGALSEMESELEAALRLAAQRGAQVQALTAELERSKATDTSAPADAKAADEDDTGEEEADAETLLQLMDFSELERYEDEGTLYPDLVDLSGWLLGHAEGSSMRFSTYVQHHLSENEQLRIAAVGPLYHIGFTLLKVEGLVKQEDDSLCLPMPWRRFLLQLQQVLDAQLQATVLSPADSAKCFYALASSAGLLGNLASPPRDPLTGYSLIIAALCVCLRSPSPSTSTDSSCKWHCCQAILHHVSRYGDGKTASQTGRSIADADSQAPDSLFLALCAEFPAATALPEEDAGDEGATAGGGTASVPLPCSIRLAALLTSDLLSDYLPISHLALCAAALSDIVDSKVAPIEGQLPASSQTEATKIFAAARPRLSFAQKRDVAPLLLYVARHEYLLFDWAHEMADAAAEAEGGSPSEDGHSTDTASLTLSSLGVSVTWPASATVQKVPSRSAAVSARATPPAEVESITQLLIFLCTGLLPTLVLAIYRCPSLEQESQLIDAFFRTRRLLMAKRTALLAKNSTEACAASGVIPGVTLLLPETRLRNLVNAALAPIKHTAPFPERAVQVPVAEYERLHHELLSLYETNDTYHRYIQELLSAAEAA